jgi:hypothetical protein
MITKLDGWREGRRRDGLIVTMGLEGWVVIPHDERPAVDRCPCCNCPLESERAAQVVADVLFPVAS